MYKLFFLLQKRLPLHLNTTTIIIQFTATKFTKPYTRDGNELTFDLERHLLSLDHFLYKIILENFLVAAD